MNFLEDKWLKLDKGEITLVRIRVHVITFRCQVHLVAADSNFFLLFRHLYLGVGVVFNFINVDVLTGRTYKLSSFRLCISI